MPSLVLPNERRRLVFGLVVVVLLAASVNMPFAVTLIRLQAGGHATDQVRVFGDEAARRGWVTPTPHQKPWPKPSDWTMWWGFGEREYKIVKRGEPEFEMSFQRVGWPLPVVEVRRMRWPWGLAGYTTPLPDPHPRLMPLGLIANPVIVGVPAWLVVVAVPVGANVFRRKRRVRRGCCAWCGYETGEHDPCPECGRAATRSADPPSGRERPPRG